MKKTIVPISFMLIIILGLLFHPITVKCSGNSIVVNNINELKESSFNSGTSVQTSGYYLPGDGGQATYVIADNASAPVDDIFVIQTKNNKYAQLVYNSSTMLNVACAGIFPEQKISDRLNLLLKNGTRKIKGIQFNSGVYYLNSGIDLYSMYFYGKDDTILSVSPDYSTMRYGIFVNADTNGKYNIDNITFEYNSYDKHILANKESVIMALASVKLCNISNCEFTATNASNNNTVIDLLWFRHSDIIDNITIVNSTFSNLTGQASDTNKIVRGGCIWFDGPTDDHNKSFSGIKLYKCTITNTTSDEAIAFWNGNFNTIRFDLSSIIAKRKTNNVISFYNCSYHDVAFTRMSFLSECIAQSIIVLESTTQQSDIRFVDCGFALDAPNASPYTDTKQVVLISNDPYNSSIKITDTEVVASDNTNYCSLITCYNSQHNTITLQNNNITCPMLYGLYYNSNSNDITANLSKNTLQNSSFIAATTYCNLCTINAKENNVIDGYSLYIKDKTNLNYRAENNSFSSNDSTPLVTYSKTSASNSNVSVYANNNGN